MTEGGVIVARAGVPTALPAAPPLAAEAERAARVMMRKSPQTLPTYQGTYTRVAVWIARRDGVVEPSVADRSNASCLSSARTTRARCSSRTNTLSVTSRVSRLGSAGVLTSRDSGGQQHER